MSFRLPTEARRRHAYRTRPNPKRAAFILGTDRRRMLERAKPETYRALPVIGSWLWGPKAGRPERSM